jgi:hypothetical protein
MDAPPRDWLKLAADRRLEVTGLNIAKALRFRGYIQLMDHSGHMVQHVTKIQDCAGFRVTERGLAYLLEEAVTGLPFSKYDPPPRIQHWLSALKRLCRNCPEGLHLFYSEGELRVLMEDTTGKVADDPIHLVASMKAPWLVE